MVLNTIQLRFLIQIDGQALSTDITGSIVAFQEVELPERLVLKLILHDRPSASARRIAFVPRWRVALGLERAESWIVNYICIESHAESNRKIQKTARFFRSDFQGLF